MVLLLILGYDLYVYLRLGTVYGDYGIGFYPYGYCNNLMSRDFSN